MRSYPGFCRRKQLEYNPGLTHRRRAGHPRANRRTSDRPSFCGVRPSCSRVIMSCHIFQSTHPLRGATTREEAEKALQEMISIHAPLAGCDYCPRPEKAGGGNFNPRTPCGVRRMLPQPLCNDALFQSTHPLRGATSFWMSVEMSRMISIHAPLAGCDVGYKAQVVAHLNFNPRTPCGVRQIVRGGIKTKKRFQSTHPLRGATARCRPRAGCKEDFNPRTPCGVRPSPAQSLGDAWLFQSTHPLRGATDGSHTVRVRVQFQSTHPLRGATRTSKLSRRALPISIHAPLAGCDNGAEIKKYVQVISIHAPLAGCDPAAIRSWCSRTISIHAPLAGCDTHK